MKKGIPLSVPNFKGNELKYVNQAVSDAWVSTGGAYINKLEANLSEYLNVSSAVACQSGTSAIHLSLMECNVKPEDYVIVPTLTFIAAVNPVRYLYANPIFMDCDDTLCMDAIKLQKFCDEKCEVTSDKLIYKKDGKQIKAIIVVHIFGNLADMDAIMEIAFKYKLIVIEDATEALGSRYISGKYNGRFAGTIGDFGTFSFNGNKIITTGGGGAVVARDTDSLKHIKYISTQAKDDEIFYIHHEIGYNYRMTNLQAALGVAQMEELDLFIQDKNSNYEIYKQLFKNCNLSRLLPFRKDIFSNKWFYSLEIEMDKIDLTIKELVCKLQDKGIQTRPIWGLIHEQKPYYGFLAYEIEKAKHYANRVLNIPCSTNITAEEIQFVTKEITKLLEEAFYE